MADASRPAIALPIHHKNSQYLQRRGDEIRIGLVAVVLHEMPAIWDESFRRSFYERWGRENCIIAARTQLASYPDYQQRLSIKAAWGGSESYFVDRRRIAVDDDSFLILNDARTYSSALRCERPMLSFSIFFRPGMADEVAAHDCADASRLLDVETLTASGSVEFSEHVRPHDRLISPVLLHTCAPPCCRDIICCACSERFSAGHPWRLGRA